MSTFSGTVITGWGKATTLGFPSINIEHQGPESGVYVGYADVEGIRYPAAIFADTTRGLLEAHLLDFAPDSHTEMTGQQIHLTLLQKIHERMHFSNVEDLKANIAKDVEIVRAYFREHPITAL